MATDKESRPVPEAEDSAPTVEAVAKSPKKRMPSWMVVLTWVFRCIAGGVFMYSGFVKAVDPLGTVYKFEEYFAVMGLSDLAGAAVPLAFLLFILEFLVGASLISGSYRRSAPWWAAAFMAVMLPLTLWIAVKDPVADCGCFGDALVISNWATFWKNVALSGIIVWLILYNRRLRCLIAPPLQWLGFLGSLALPLLTGWLGYNVQPLIDFRPYPAGTLLATQQSAADEEDSADEAWIGVWTDGTHTIELPLDSIPEGESWEFVDRKPATGAKPGTASEESEQKGLAVYTADEESNPADDVIVSSGKQILICFDSLKDISASNFYRLNSLYNFCRKYDIELTAIAAATPDQIAAFRDLSLAEYPIYTAEDTAIKELVRGNPGIVFLKDGRIVWKQRLSALPYRDFMTSATPASLEKPIIDSGHLLAYLWIFYAVLNILLVFASFTPKLYRLLGGRRKNRFVKESLCLLALFVPLSSCSDSDDEPDEKPEAASVTLIYMAGANSLGDNLTLDLNEIKTAAASLDLSRNHLLLFCSRSGEDPTLYEVKSDGQLKPLMSYRDGSYAVSPRVINEVIERVRREFPAESYGLFFWSHGSGWAPGTNALTSAPQRAWGDDYGRSVNLPQLAGAIPSGMFDYIWFDCCYMGGIETVYELRDKADLIVAHPTEIMAQGAPYDKILPLLCRATPDVRGAVQTEWDYYRSLSVTLGFTVSVTATEGLPQMAAAASDILRAAGNEYVFTPGLQRYGSVKVRETPTSPATAVVFYDLLSYYEKLCPADRPELMDNFRHALDRSVVLKYATPSFDKITIDPEHYSGLSTFVPLPADAVGYSSWLVQFYSDLTWAKSIGYQVR